ncbi:MAG: hypothetical protein IJS88_04160 [Alphaproteobacteria bacterium]|nr:hypothetical protein [Alphaproteobacteria bacterium]
MELDLFKASHQADVFCRIYCKAQADLHLKCDNAVLVKLKTEKNRTYIVWMDPNELKKGVLSIVRAFYENQTEYDNDIGKVYAMETIKIDSDVFCYNGEVYYLYGAMNGNYCIRKLMAYGSQKVVEQVERQTYEGKEIENIFLSNFYLLDGSKKNYALTCWGISYDGECNYLPVFAEDKHYVEGYSLSAFVREEVRVGDIFKNNGYYYKLQQDEDGKLWLDCSKMVFTLNKPSRDEKLSEFSSAQVIIANFKK